MTKSLALLGMLSLAGFAAAQDFTVLADENGGTVVRRARQMRAAAQAKSGVNRVISMPGDVVFPQLADGAGWRTSWTLTNMDATSQNVRLGFADDQGFDMSIPVTVGGRPTTAALVAITLAAGASVLIETEGTSSTLRQGFALILNERNKTVGGIGVFRQRVAGRPDFEAVVPAVSLFDDRVVLFFDNTNGYTTAAAVLSAFADGDLDVNVTIRDENGSLLETTTLRMAEFTKKAFTLPTQWSSTQNRRGTIEMRVSQSTGFSVMGLRFNPGGAFTSFHGLTNSAWFVP